MKKQKPPKYQAYVVWEGRTLGIFEKWADVQKATDGYRGAVFAGFEDYDYAQKMWEKFEEEGRVPSWGEIRRMKLFGATPSECTAANCRYPNCKCK